MKRLLITSVFVLSLWGVAQAQTKMTLAEAIEYAEKNNQNIQNAQLEFEKSKAKVAEQLAAGYPQINGSADLGYNYIIPTTFIPDFISPSVYGVLFEEGVIPTKPLPEPEVFPAQFGTKYSGRAAVDVSQMVFDGSFFVGLKASRTYTELSRKDHIKTTIDVVAAVKKAYYMVLVNTERLELLEKNYNRLDTLLQETRIMQESGFAEKIDVSRIQVQFNNIKVARSNATVGLKLSKDLLKFQMGMPMSEELELSDTLESIQYKALEENFGEGFEYTHRIEFSKLQTNFDLTGIDIKYTKVQYMPKIDLYANIGASYGTGTFNNMFAFGESWFGLGTVGLRLNVPIFDGFRKRSIIQQKQYQQQQVEHNMELVKNQIDLEKLQSEANLTTSIENLRAQRENMALAEDVYNVTKIKYEQGVGSNIEVLDADAAFKEAQTNYYAALYDALIASVDVETAYGKLLENEND